MGLSALLLVCLWSSPLLAEVKFLGPGGGDCKGKPRISQKEEKKAAARGPELRKKNQASFDAAFKATQLTKLGEGEVTQLEHFGSAVLFERFKIRVAQSDGKYAAREIDGHVNLDPGALYSILSVEKRPGYDLTLDEQTPWKAGERFVFLGTHRSEVCTGPKSLVLHGAIEAEAFAARDQGGGVWAVLPKPQWEYEKRLKGCLVDSGVRCAAMGKTVDYFLFLNDKRPWAGVKELPYQERVVEAKYEIIFGRP